MGRRRQGDGEAPRRTRRRGEGCIQKKGRAFYFRRATDRRDEKGRTVYSVTRLDARTRDEAEAEADRIVREESMERNVVYLQAKLDLARGTAGAARQALAIPEVWAAWESCQTRPDCSAATLRQYLFQWRRFERWLAERHPECAEMRDVSAAVADEFMGSLRGLSANTANKHLVLLRAMWGALRRRSGCQENPWEDIQRRVGTPHSRRELSEAELRAVLEAADEDMRLLLCVGIYTGLRLGDAATLEWGAVDLEGGVIVLTPRKTARHAGTTVRIPVPAPLAGLLGEVPEERRRGPVCPWAAELYARGGDGLSRRIQAAFRRAGIETQSRGARKRAMVDVGYHSLRHTYVSLCANAGVPLAVVQSIVGHTSPAMTTHYYHADDGALRGAAAALPDVVGAGEGEDGAAPESAAMGRFRRALAGLSAGELAGALEAVREAMARGARR